MVQVGKKFVCTNDSCSHIELSSGKAWYMNIADDSSYWNDSTINKAPSIIACEYYKLYNLFKQGAVHALPYKIKDIFEVEVKFLTLIKLSQAFHNNEYKKAYASLLFKILNSPPSMGTWVSIGQALVNLGKEDIISRQLKKIIKICFKHNIVNWRNNTIGHGALYIVESRDFQMDITKKIRLLSDYYSSSTDTYEAVSLFVKGSKKRDYIPLVGHRYVNHNAIKLGKIFVTYGNTTFELLPLIKYISEEMYLYDSYDSRRNVANFLSYNINHKIREKDIALEKMRSYLNLDMHVRGTCVPVDEDFINVSRLTDVDAVICPRNIIRINSLFDRYNKILRAENKGIFLMQMEDGMGKTTFVKVMDTLSYYHEKQSWDSDEQCMVRATYINSVYGYKPRYFIAELIHALRTTNEKELLSGDIPAIDIFDDNARIKLAKFINDIYDYNKAHNHITKLIVFIDGIDEIPYTEGHTIVNIIPHNNDLNDGIYIFLTTRSEEQLSGFTRENILPNLKIDKTIAINSTDNSYRDDLKSGVKKFLKDDNIADKILELSQNKIINIEYIIQAYQQYGANSLEKWIGIEGYWKFMKSTYGEQYYHEIKKIAFILSITPVPISVALLAVLLGEDHVTFKLLAFLGELKQFVSSQREADGTLIIISRSEVRDFLQTQTMMKEVETTWMQQLNMYRDTKKLSEEDASIVAIIIAISLIYSIGDKRALNDASEKYISYIIGNCNHLSKWLFNLNMTIFDNIIAKVKLNSITKLFNPNQLMLFIYAFAPQMEIGGDYRRFIEGAECVLKEFESDINPFLLQKIYVLLEKAYGKIDEVVNAYHYARKAQDSISNSLFNTDSGYDISEDSIELMKVEALLTEALISKNNKQYNKAYKLIEKASKLVDNIFPSRENEVGFCILKANICQIYGNIYKRMEPNKAIHYFEECYRLLGLIGEEETFRSRIMCYLNIGQTYRVLHDYEKAIRFYDKGLSLFNEAEIKGSNISMEDKASLYNSKANIYRDINENKKALSFYSLAIDLIEKEIDNEKSISVSFYIALLSSRMAIYERLGMMEESKLDAEKFKQYYRKANVLTLEHNEQNYGKEENISIATPDELYESANDDIKLGRINSAQKKLKAAILLEDKKPMYFFDYAYCFSALNDNVNAAINTLRGLSLIAPTYETIQTGGCKLSTLKTYGKENYMLQILEVQTMNTYSMYPYLKLIGEFSRAIMHFNYGWYLEAHSMNMGEMVLSAQKTDMLIELRRKDNAEIIRDVMREAIKKGRRVNDITYGDKLLKNAIRILDTQKLSNEDINATFLKWLPDAQAEELDRLQKIYSFDMIAFEMMNRSLEYGSLTALRFIRDFYKNPNYFAYDENVSEKSFIERNGTVELC